VCGLSPGAAGSFYLGKFDLRHFAVAELWADIFVVVAFFTQITLNLPAPASGF
jgi:hypothetical protein